MKSLLQRTVTGLLIVAAIMAGILFGPYSFITVFSILVFGTLYEFYNLINVSREVHINKILHSLAGSLLFFCVWLEASHLTSHWVLLIYLAYVMAMFISRLYTCQSNPLRELAFIILGQVYIAAPLALVNQVAFHTLKYPLGEILKDYCPIFVLSLFLFIWVNDTGAFLTGCTLGRSGRHRLFPRVSPKKSWEGFWGGMFFCMLLGLGLYYPQFWEFIGVDIHEGVKLTRLEWMGMAMTVSIFATFGDLIESFVKRSVGVKDSGNILPGHGGIWDRFDSLIMAAPAIYIYLVVSTIF